MMKIEDIPHAQRALESAHDRMRDAVEEANGSLDDGTRIRVREKIENHRQWLREQKTEQWEKNE